MDIVVAVKIINTITYEKYTLSGLLLLLFCWRNTCARQKPSGPGKYDQFAQCLADKGAKFYGAFWCPHCQNQKRMFGSKSAKLLPYTECSTPDGKGTTQACIDAGVKSYPTWKFADGTELVGEIPLIQLAEKQLVLWNNL